MDQNWKSRAPLWAVKKSKKCSLKLRNRWIEKHITDFKLTTSHYLYCIIVSLLSCVVSVLRQIFIRLEGRLQPNIGFTLWRVLAVFTRFAITPPEVNRFGWNLKHSEYTVGGWPWHILSAFRAVATAGEPGEILFFCKVNNARFHRFPVGQIFTKFKCNT